EAARAYGRAQIYDSENPEPVIRRAFPQLRLRLKSPAKKSIEAYDEMVAGKRVSPYVRALADAARGRLELVEERLPRATTFATRAVDTDPASVEGHLLLADLALARERPADKHLRDAIGYPNVFAEA